MGDDKAITSPPGIGALPVDVREQWHAESFTLDWEAEDFGWGRIELERQMEFVGLAASAGVRVVAGTDTPNPFVLPGQSMHDDLELLCRLGPETMQAIVAGASRAARTTRPGRPDRRRQARLLRRPARGARRSGQQHHGHPLGRAGHQIRPDRLRRKIPPCLHPVSECNRCCQNSTYCTRPRSVRGKP